MAERRMFSKSVIESDKFLDLSHSAQALYLHLNMAADDDGFVQAPHRIARMACCDENILSELSSSGFIICFDSGIIVLTDWKLNNYIQPDRYHVTSRTQERALLRIDSAKRYYLADNFSEETDAPDTAAFCEDATTFYDEPKSASQYSEDAETEQLRQKFKSRYP